MSSRINRWDASKIAGKISELAFAHLYAPIQAKRVAIAQQAYDAITIKLCLNDNETLRMFKQYGVIDLKDSTTIKITCPSDDIEVELTSNSCNMIGTDRWSSLTFESQELFDQLSELDKALQPLEEKRSDLRAEIAEQIEGKSPATVLKNWPEAAEIITEVTGYKSKKAIVVPLSDLLARFLPMLPAPKE